jgi:hypothetical protein
MAARTEQPEVILIGDHDDEDLTQLSHALLIRGVRLARIILGEPDTAIEITVANDVIKLRQGQTELVPRHFENARGVFYRRWKMCIGPIVRSTLPDPEEARFAEKEWNALLISALRILEQLNPNVPWINPVGVDQMGRDKLFLLNQASRVGMTAPEWVASNVFTAPVPGPLVAKAINVDQHIDDKRNFSTSAVEPEFVGLNLGRRSPCPSLLQRRIAAEHELRVFYVNGELVSLKLQTSEPVSDIRYAKPGSLKCRLTDCPASLAPRIHKFCDSLSLRYAALDLLAEAGTYHLVDVTPNACWSGFELTNGAGMSEDIADALLASLA